MARKSSDHRLSQLCINQEAYLLQREVARQQSLNVPPSLIWTALWLDGHLELGALRSALQRVVDRHASLQTAIISNPAIPSGERDARVSDFGRNGHFHPGLFVQSIVNGVPSELELIDATGMTIDEFNRYLRMLREEVHNRQTDYQCPPFMRSFLLKVKSDKHLMLLFIDHIISDGWSLALLQKEIVLQYSRYALGGAEISDEVGMSYPEFALWQNQLYTTAYFEKALQFWESIWSRFGSARIGFKHLPFYRESATNFKFGIAHTSLSSAESDSIMAFLRRSRVSLYMFFLTAYIVLLRQYTGKARIAVWGHFANRKKFETLNTIGFLSNTHLLGFDLSQNPSGIDLLAEVRTTVARAAAHQEMPLPYLWRMLRCYPRFQDASPSLRVATVERRDAETTNLASGLSIEPAALPPLGAIGFSTLGAYVILDRGQLSLSIGHPEAIFPPNAIQQLVEDLKSIALALVAQPVVRLDELLRDVLGYEPKPDPGPGEMDEFLLCGSDLISREHGPANF